MKIIITILLLFCLNAEGQVIRANAYYTPFAPSLLLDIYPNAAAAYSLRKIRTAYTGAAIRVRKDTTGQPEQDISFDANGNLDTVALKSFINARNGFVVTWYDQSGNGRNASQSTQANQPRISNLGVIDRRSGDISIVFDGTNDYLINTVNGYQINNITHYAVSSRGNSANTLRTIYSTGILTSSNGFGFFYADNTNFSSQNLLFQQARNELISVQSIGTYANTLNSNNLIFGITTSSIDYTYYNGGDEKTLSHTRSSVTSNNQTLIGARLNNTLSIVAHHLNGTVSELVFWPSNQSANRTAIQNNINTYYSIY